MKKPDSQVAYNLQLSLGWLPCNVHGDRSDSFSLFFGWLLGFEPTIPCLFLYRSQDSIPPPLIPIFSSRPHLLSSLVLFSLLPSLFLYFFFFYDSCMYFSWLADFLTTLLPSRYQSPVCSSSRSSNRLWGWALTPSCSTWKISCCQYCGWLAGINPLDADWILGMRLCTTTV